MSAVLLVRPPLTPSPRGAGSSTRHLELYRSGPRAAGPRTAPSRTVLRAPSARAHRQEPAVYRRRRLLAAGVSLLAIAAVLVMVQLIQAGIGGGPLATTGAAAGSGLIPAGATEYVVRPGDTLWSIAAALAPGRDERPLVDELAQQLGGTSLYPGEQISLPARR